MKKLYIKLDSCSNTTDAHRLINIIKESIPDLKIKLENYWILVDDEEKLK